MPLTDEAKAEIAAAIAIVRADKFEAHARGVLNKFTPVAPKKDELIVPGTPPVVDPANPPPAKDPIVTDPPKTPKRSAYWGEILDD